MGAKIKICGLFRPEDIACANEVRPDYVGFVFAESRRQVSREKAGELRRILHPGILAVGVFMDAPLAEIVSCVREEIIDIIQLHGQETEEDIQYLKSVTGKPVIKAVKMHCPSQVESWLDSRADYLLFDSGAGTGKIFDWNLLSGVHRNYFLAGGLEPGNLKAAMEKLNPYAVDLSTGVETRGVKDLEKMKTAVGLVRERSGKG